MALTQSHISQLNWYLNNIRKSFEDAVDAGEREFIKCFELFNGAITLRVCAFNDWREGIFSLNNAYSHNFGDAIEIFDYKEQNLIDMFGEDAYDEALEEIAERAKNA
jgi:hypothetical protein